MFVWKNLIYFPLGLCVGLASYFTVMGPAHRTNRSSVGPRDPLAPPPFRGEGNPMVWARPVQKWVRAHEALCKQNDKRGFPAYLRGDLLSEVLYGTAFRTVESTLSEDVINSDDGVDAIVGLLAKFNPTTAAHEIFTAYKGLMQIRRGGKESFKLYVNRFEAAPSELRSLTGQDQHGEAEQLLAFQLLEGAQIPTAVFLQVLTNCLDASDVEKPKVKEESTKNPILAAMQDEIEAVRGLKSEGLIKELEQIEKSKAERIIKIFEVAMEKIASSFSKIYDNLEDPSQARPATLSAARAAVTIDFESAKKALRGLDAVSLEASFGIQQQERVEDRAEMHKIVRQTLLSQQASTANRAGPAGRNGKRSEKQKPANFRAQIARRKTRTICHDCKRKGHWAGDAECPKRKGIANPAGSMLASAVNEGDGEKESSETVFFH